MSYSVRAQGMLRAARNGLARLNHLLLEAGSADEDLVFHIRNPESDGPLPGRSVSSPSAMNAPDATSPSIPRLRPARVTGYLTDASSNLPRGQCGAYVRSPCE